MELASSHISGAWNFEVDCVLFFLGGGGIYTTLLYST